MDEQIVSNSQFLHAAFHESGHAVAAHELGLRVDRVWVDLADGGDVGGSCEVSPADSGSRTWALCAIAGVAAAAEWERGQGQKRSRQMYNGEPLTTVPIWPDASPEDGDGVREYLRRNYFSGETARVEVRALRQEASDLVRGSWSKIRAVSLALNDASKGGPRAELNRSQFLAAVK